MTPDFFSHCNLATEVWVVWLSAVCVVAVVWATGVVFQPCWLMLRQYCTGGVVCCSKAGVAACGCSNGFAGARRCPVPCSWPPVQAPWRHVDDGQKLSANYQSSGINHQELERRRTRVNARAEIKTGDQAQQDHRLASMMDIKKRCILIKQRFC